jgi:hypothetical protein
MWQLLDTVDPASRTFLHRRQLLADALQELADTQAIQLPSRRSYDRSEHPALPRFITIPAPEPRTPSAARTVWHPALSWAAGLAVGPTHRPILEKINQWLFHQRDELVVPLRERSLEILGDEKALDRLQTTSLFGPDRLTLALLRARRVALPMHTVRVGDGPILLVVENSDTFDSLRTVLTRAPGRVRLVAWGAGTAFGASVASIATMPGVEEVAYFGDLDARGLQIPVNASKLATVLGLPDIRPADGLYTALRAVGRTHAGQPRLDASVAATLTAWLGSRLRPWADQLMRSGIRMAQEAVGLAYLTKHNDWRSDLA